MFRVAAAAAAAAAAVVLVAVARSSAESTRESDARREVAIRQEEFDGMPLPETSDIPTVTQVTPAIVNIGHRYGVPQPQYLGKKKHGPGKKDDYMDHLMGASLVSGGTLISLGALAMVVMASKALLFAFGAILLTCLTYGWPLKQGGGGGSGTVYEVVAKPQVMHGHSYSAEVHHEPYAPQTFPDDYGYSGGGAGAGAGAGAGPGAGGGGGGGGYGGRGHSHP